MLCRAAIGESTQRQKIAFTGWMKKKLLLEIEKAEQFSDKIFFKREPIVTIFGISVSLVLFFVFL